MCTLSPRHGKVGNATTQARACDPARQDVLPTLLIDQGGLHSESETPLYLGKVCAMSEFRDLAAELLRVDTKLKYAFVPDAFRPHCIGDAAGSFLYMMVCATRATSVVEIGTSYGYSTMWLAAALREHGGTLLTIDRDADRSAAAKRLLTTVGLEKNVEFVVGRGEDQVALLDAPPDFALIDADKEVYSALFDALLAKVGAASCLIVCDNMISHRSRLASFVTHLDLYDRVVHQLLPIGKGLELCFVGGIRGSTA